MAKLKLEEEKYWKKLVNQSLIRFLLLKALRVKNYHGYALTNVIENYTDGFSKPTQSTLYPALNELERGGYIKVKKQLYEGRERKVYSITDKGKDAFRMAAKIWGQLIPILRKASIL